MGLSGSEQGDDKRQGREGVMMAEHSVPHFHNSAGHAAISIGVKEFMCIGAKPPFDHPHIYLDMGADEEIICPYCSTLFRYQPSLKSALACPADAVYIEASAA